MANSTPKKRDIIWWITVIIVIVSLLSTPVLVLISIFTSGTTLIK